MVSIVLIASPVYAFISQQTYARVVQQAQQIAYQAAKKPAIAQAVAQAAIAATPGSIAIRAVTGPVGWAVLGVLTLLPLLQTYYSSNDLTNLKQAATPSGLFYTYNGQSYQLFGYSNTTPMASCPGGIAYFYPGTGFTAPHPGMTPVAFDWWCPASVPVPAGDPTQDQLAQFLQTLPASDPQSIDNHTQPMGIDPVPQPAQTEVIVPATPAELPTTVKKTQDVLQTDVVVNKDVPAPAGTVVVQTAQQTATTATTANPDGSQTEQQTATTSCASGSHDQRTFGSVLIEHQTKWNNAPLLSALNQLKTLAWPSTLPVLSFSSLLFGSFQVDFNTWSWVFLALKTLILAGASFAAYRIVFVGGR